LATVVGQWELKPYRQGPHLEVDIVAQHKAGVQSLQLPPLPANVLASWGIHPVKPTPLWKALAYWAAVIGSLVLARRLWQQWWLARQLRNAAPQVRFQAVAALARMGSRWSARKLTRTLQDSNEHVRQAAEAALQARGEVVTVKAGLQQRPVGLPSLRARRRALLALAVGEFDTVVVVGRPSVAQLSAP
jgi:hypothetical protein